jgi:hypothetical protein
MTIFKVVLRLLAIFVAYGVVGRLDYEDALRLEQIRQERRDADCLTGSTPVVREPLVQSGDPTFDPRPRGAAAGLPKHERPCAPRTL